MDAHAKEGSDVDIVTHKVLRCFFKVSSGMNGWKNCVEEHTQRPTHKIYRVINVLFRERSIATRITL